MKAIIKEDRKPGLFLRNIEKPKVKQGHLLVKVHACSICGGDNYLYKWTKIMDTWNIPLPLVIGHEFCGDVVEIGDEPRHGASYFAVGDRIAADSHVYCNECAQCLANRKHICENVKVFGIHTDGGFAEYVNVPAHIAFKVPQSLSYEEGALLEPFGVGVKSYNTARPNLSDNVAVIGAGPIGLFIAKLCVVSGIMETFVFDPVGFRQEFVRELGIRHSLDPLNRDVTKSLTGKMDVVFEASGTAEGLQDALALVAPNGTVIIIGAQQDKVSVDVKNDIMVKEITVRGTYGRLIWDTWHQMMRILENSDIHLRQFITHRFVFDRFEDAFSVSLRGNCGKIVLFPDEVE